MFDADRILRQLMNQPVATGLAGGLAGGVAGGMLTSKRGRKMAKKAAKYGGVALLGGLAYSAWQKHRQGVSPSSAPAGATAPPPVPLAPPEATAFVPAESDAPAREALGILLMRTMIAAAKADGKLDGDESRAIRGKLAELDLPEAERSRLLQEVASPASVHEIALQATGPEMGAEVYLAALMAIETDTDEERAWLAQLAQALGLDPGYVELLHAEAEID